MTVAKLPDGALERNVAASEGGSALRWSRWGWSSDWVDVPDGPRRFFRRGFARSWNYVTWTPLGLRRFRGWRLLWLEREVMDCPPRDVERLIVGRREEL